MIADMVLLIEVGMYRLLGKGKRKYFVTTKIFNSKFPAYFNLALERDMQITINEKVFLWI